MPHKLCCDWLGAYLPKFGILEPNEAGKVTYGNIRSGTKSDLLRKEVHRLDKGRRTKDLGRLDYTLMHCNPNPRPGHHPSNHSLTFSQGTHAFVDREEPEGLVADSED
jgi:hypothetical protein